MTIPDRRQSFADLLMTQDQPIPATQWKEYRMHLEQRLAATARTEKRVRIIAMVAWLAAVLVPLGIVLLDRIQRGMSLLPPIRLGLPPEVHAVPGPLGSAAGIFYMVTVLFAWLIVLVYFVKSRPSLRRARDEYQTALMADLQRQIAELKQK